MTDYDIPKVCKKCRWLKGSEAPADWDFVCAHPSNINLVTGAPDPLLAGDMRGKDGRCGREAKLFEPKGELEK